MCYFIFKKNKKNWLQFTFEKNNLLGKKEKKITCHMEKSQHPLDIKWSVLKAGHILRYEANTKHG